MMITPRQNCLCEEVATQEAGRTLGIPQPSFARPRNQTRKTKEACTWKTEAKQSRAVEHDAGAILAANT